VSPAATGEQVDDRDRERHHERDQQQRQRPAVDDAAREEQVGAGSLREVEALVEGADEELRRTAHLAEPLRVEARAEGV